MKKKQLDAEDKKSKRKTKKGKIEKQGEAVTTAAPGKHPTENNLPKAASKKTTEAKEPVSLLCSEYLCFFSVVSLLYFHYCHIFTI